MASPPITEAEVRQFVDDWFAKLDRHVAVADILPLVADDGLVMKLPETTAYGHRGFIAWYEHAINTYFDEIHTIAALRITPAPETATVEMVLKWEPVVWRQPAAKSTRLGFYAAQTWQLKRVPETHQLVLLTYNVDYFIPVAGSEEL